MKNPVLRIRKGVKVYDDNQEEPAPLLRVPDPPLRRRARRAPRKGRLNLLPFVALALALVVVFRVVPRAQANRAFIGGWNPTLRASADQDALQVSVTFVKEAPAGAPIVDGPQATVRIVLPDTGQEISLSGILSKSPITLRGQIDYSPRVKRVQAEVSVGADRKTLRLTARTARARTR
jgi:hypothetical protein